MGELPHHTSDREKPKKTPAFFKRPGRTTIGDSLTNYPRIMKRTIH